MLDFKTLKIGDVCLIDVECIILITASPVERRYDHCCDKWFFEWVYLSAPDFCPEMIGESDTALWEDRYSHSRFQKLN